MKPPRMPWLPPSPAPPTRRRREASGLGLSVNHPVFKAGQTKDLRIEFTLVNDGDR